MTIKMLAVLLSFARLASGQQPYLKDAEVFYEKAMAVIKPAYKAQVIQSATMLRGRTISADSLNKAFRNTGEFAKFSEKDIEAFTLLVMMEASKPAAEDVKAMMANVKRLNEKKQVLRDKSETLKQQDLSKQDIRKKLDSLKKELDQLNELNEKDQRRLQMFMERKSKREETMSNIMKRIADTQQSIINNLK